MVLGILGLFLFEIAYQPVAIDYSLKFSKQKNEGGEEQYNRFFR